MRSPSTSSDVARAAPSASCANSSALYNCFQHDFERPHADLGAATGGVGRSGALPAAPSLEADALARLPLVEHTTQSPVGADQLRADMLRSGAASVGLAVVDKTAPLALLLAAVARAVRGPAT
jgi:hypothetical protein